MTNIKEEWNCEVQFWRNSYGEGVNAIEKIIQSGSYINDNFNIDLAFGASPNDELKRLFFYAGEPEDREENTVGIEVEYSNIWVAAGWIWRPLRTSIEVYREFDRDCHIDEGNIKYQWKDQGGYEGVLYQCGWPPKVKPSKIKNLTKNKR